MPYTNYSIILKQPTKAYIPVPLIDASENLIIADTSAWFQWKQTSLN